MAASAFGNDWYLSSRFYWFVWPVARALACHAQPYQRVCGDSRRWTNRVGCGPAFDRDRRSRSSGIRRELARWGSLLFIRRWPWLHVGHRWTRPVLTLSLL